MPSLSSPPRPSKLRLSALMFLAVYPFVTGLLYILMPLTEGWPIWERTLILVPIMVVSIVYVIAPTIQARFGRFIARHAHSAGA